MAKKKPTKQRRTNERIFLDTLSDLYDGTPIGNSTLRDELGWDEEKYWQVHGRLRGRSIEVGKGKGGSVIPIKGKKAKSLSVFVSYSHADEKLKVEIVKHLDPLRRLGLIEAWHDRMIKAGSSWGDEIHAKLKAADIVLVLVSIDFINSQYCYDIELEEALRRHATGEAVVVPVILRACLWHSTPIARIQALPTDGKAVTSWPDQDQAFAQIAEGIKLVAEQRLGASAMSG